MSPAGRVGTYFAVGTTIVPEPGTALLLGLGLMWLSIDPRAHRAADVTRSLMHEIG